MEEFRGVAEVYSLRYNWNRYSQSSHTDPSFIFRASEPTLIFVFTLLRPQDLFQNDRPNHHSHNEEPDTNQDWGHDTADDLYNLGVEDSTNSKSRRDERSIGKDVRVPSHLKFHSSSSNAGPVGANGYEEEPESETPYPKAHPGSNDFKDHCRNYRVPHEVVG